MDPTDTPGQPTPSCGVWVDVKGPPFAEYTWPLPKVVIDGTTQRKVKWGQSGFFAVEPGRHRIEAYFWFIRPKAGRAELEMDVAAGQVYRFTYAAPRNAFMKGKFLNG